MSKPTTRIIVSIVIALVLLIALYTSVQGGLSSKVLKAGSNSAQVHVVNGLKTNLNHDRSTVAELEAALQSEQYIQPAGQGHGGCDHELSASSED